MSQAGGNPARRPYSSKRRQPAVIVHQIAPLGSRRLFYVSAVFPKWEDRTFSILQSSFLWPLRNRAAEQGNRVRIPDGNRRCMRDVRCSSTKVRHWGRTPRRQSRSAKAETLCPKRKSEDIQKEDELGTGRRARRLRAQKNGCG